MPVIHEDAIDTAFVATQLESVLSKLYIQYPATPYSSIVPVDSSDHEGAIGLFLQARFRKFAEDFALKPFCFQRRFSYKYC